VTVEQLRERHLRARPVHLALTAVLKGMSHHFGVGPLAAVGFEWIGAERFEFPARADAVSFDGLLAFADDALGASSSYRLPR
jgi:hypothetical protein